MRTLKRHTYQETGRQGICSFCSGPAREIRVREENINTHRMGWELVSHCCREEVEEGGFVEVRQTVCTARRDHTNDPVKKGDRYVATVYRCWRKNGPGWFVTEKKVVEKAGEVVKQKSAG